MSSTYKDPSTLQKNADKTFQEPSTSHKDEIETEKKIAARPEQLNLLDLNLMDTKPYVNSPGTCEYNCCYFFELGSMQYYFLQKPFYLLVVKIDISSENSIPDF